MARSSFLAVALLAAALPSFAQLPNENDRLMATARLWVTVEYFHPQVAAGLIDWDQPLLAALPAIRSAKSIAEYRAALSSMLGALHDDETHLLQDDEALPNPPPADPIPHFSILQTALGPQFLLHPRTSADRLLLQLPGFRAVLRLSTAAKPDAMAPVPSPHPQISDPYPSTPYPTAEARLLAAVKTWGAIHYFFAYKDLADEDWDDVCASYLPKFIAARDATDYNLILADLLTHLTDSNTAPHSPTLDAYFGQAPVGLRIRLLDKYPIITDVLDPAAIQAGVHPGDVLKRIGNESITDRFHRLVQYVPASTPQRSGYDTIQRITNGPAGSEVALTIENAQGDAHVVTLTRRNLAAAHERSTEAVRILANNIGYLDLDRLAPDAADESMSRLQNTTAIIFDLRGRAPAASVIAAHLIADTTAAVALVNTPIALRPDIPTAGIATQTASTFVVQSLPAPRQPHYKGKTIALIDERTVGESEFAGLLFEAANKTEFVGTPSAGADSTLAELPLPGGITVTYSTEDIRHGNGGKLQRLGLQPNTSAPATARGIRAGKDEPLDAALALLSPPVPKQLASYTHKERSKIIR